MNRVEPLDRAAVAVFRSVNGYHPVMTPVEARYYEIARVVMSEMGQAHRSDVDTHPEDSCDRCGGNNPSWSVDSDRWNLAVRALGISRGAVLCPGCFVEGHELATGMKASWDLTPATVFRWPDLESVQL